MSARIPPPELVRLGLLRAETNKQAGQGLVLPPSLLGEAFGQALFKRLVAKKQAALEEKNSCKPS